MYNLRPYDEVNSRNKIIQLKTYLDKMLNSCTVIARPRSVNPHPGNSIARARSQTPQNSQRAKNAMLPFLTYSQH